MADEATRRYSLKSWATNRGRTGNPRSHSQARASGRRFEAIKIMRLGPRASGRISQIRLHSDTCGTTAASVWAAAFEEGFRPTGLPVKGAGAKLSAAHGISACADFDSQS